MKSLRDVDTERRKDRKEFRDWLAKREIDKHLSKTLSPSEIDKLKRVTRLSRNTYFDG